MSTEAVAGLEPALVWKYFSEIAKIPRPSKHEERIAAYVIETAKKLGLQAKQDRAGNVVVKKPASPGREQGKMICLQGHLDMVCERNADKQHDFMKDPIELVRNDNTIMANGTTLGADNGIAVATNLAIMEDRTLDHGPLELLFTIDEETGLTGASMLDPSFLESRTLLNLDSEEEGALYVGCAGGRDTLGTWKVNFVAPPKNYVAVQVSVKGLRGGHSGLEIDKGRGNAIKIMARVLTKLYALGSLISSIDGGNKRNAIPRECTAIIAIPEAKLTQAKNLVENLNTTLKAEIATVDPDMSISLQELSDRKKIKVVKKAQQTKLLQSLLALPHGVLKMSADIPGLVETSTNVAVINTTTKAIVLATSQRSSVASELDEAVESVSAIFKLGGVPQSGIEHSEGYPGWKPNLASPILKLAKETYKSLYGKEPAVKAIHAGLECGIIGEKFPGMDMVSFGPTIEGAHSPNEKIYIDTVEKFWKFLLAILRNVN